MNTVITVAINTFKEKESTMYVDIGIYGIPPFVKRGTWDSVAVSRDLENYTYKKHGFHMLYADIFMTRQEFEQMFNHELYRKMRDIYNATGSFPEVYDKVIPEKWLINLNEEAEKYSEAEKHPDAKKHSEAEKRSNCFRIISRVSSCSF